MKRFVIAPLLLAAAPWSAQAKPIIAAHIAEQNHTLVPILETPHETMSMTVRTSRRIPFEYAKKQARNIHEGVKVLQGAL